MKRFLKKSAILVLLFIAINLLLLLAIPKDNNAYLCEYNHKIELLDSVSAPRLLFIGGSSLAFGTDSKTIGDSLHMNVVNMGLHAGMGIRYPLEDALQYIKKGDIVVLQFEYQNYFSGGNGESETFPAFMMATNWRNCMHLNYHQWVNIITGTPLQGIKNLKRFVKGFKGRGYDSPTSNKSFAYVKSGFNRYGDEVSHLDYPSEKYVPSGNSQAKEVDTDFVQWLDKTISRYEQAGATVVLLPPVCIESHFKVAYNESIEKALSDVNRHYIVSPSSMVLGDSCTFNTGYHVNREGVRQNTANIINALHSIVE